jgi:chromosome partitioning protein
MSFEEATRASPAHVIVVGNEKGGSGKSTIAMHIAVALIKSGKRVGTIDLDTRQRSFTHYVENRRAWASHVGRDIGTPSHRCRDADSVADDETTKGRALSEAVEELARDCDFIVIDTPGHDSALMRLAHTMADTLVKPLNDSFVDLDVLGSVDPETFSVTGTSHYARMVEEARRQRQLRGQSAIKWIVLRNRLSMLGSRNKRLVGDALHELSRRLDFQCVEGLAERVIFREFYPRGLTAVDDLDEITLGTRPTMSHATARMEMESLLSVLRSEAPAANREGDGGDRAAA